MKRTLVQVVLAALIVSGGTMITGVPTASGAKPTPQQRLSAGSFHSVMLTAKGQLYGVGLNYFGQLTGGGVTAGTTTRTTLTVMPGIPKGVTAQSVSAGTNHTIVLGSDGKVYGTGEAQYGEIGGSMTLRRGFGVVPGLPKAVRATRAIAGEHQTLVIGSNGSVYGTGSNVAGQLTGTDWEIQRLTKLTGLPSGVMAVDVASGAQHSVVLGSNGRVYGTGANDMNQLTGDGPGRTTLEMLPALPGGATAVDVEAGTYTTLVLGSNGVLYGVGAGGEGQLTGDPYTKSALTAFTGLPAGVDVLSMSGGAAATLVVGSDGKAYATGWNYFGATTGATDTKKTTLTPMTGLPGGVRASAVAAGYYHSLVLGSDGRVYATGDATRGQVGGTEERRTLTVIKQNLVLEHIGKKPIIKGKKNQGAVLKVTGVARSDFRVKATKVSYQWYRGAAKIPGATKASYRVKAADKGKKVTVRVTGSRPGYKAAVARSKVVHIKNG